MNQFDHIDEHLLLQYLLGKCDPAVSGEIEEWLNRSGANRKHLDRLEVLWLETGKLTPPPVAVDTAAAWQRLSARMDEEEKSRKIHGGGRIIRMQTLGWSAGIAAAVIIGLAFWWFGVFSPNNELLMMASMEEVITDTLPDGSVVTLNKNSSLLYPESFEPGKRTVILLGEAFFKVVPDPSKPFVVEAGRAGIEVLGTSFDVSAYPDQPVEVIVNTGKVNLYHQNAQTGEAASVILTAGMKGLLSPDSQAPVVDPVHQPDDLFWMDRTLEFRQTPLKEVIQLLERAYRVKILLSSEAISSCRLTATFSGEPADLILQVIADTFSLELDQTNGTYLLTGNDCGEGNR